MTDHDHANDALLVRRALLASPTAAVLGLVDQLNLQPKSRMDVVVLAPLRNVKKSRNVESFAASAPLGAVRFLVDTLTNEALERVVALLGDRADDPTYEELAGAVDDMLREGFTGNVVAGMLVAAATSHVPAEPHCRQLLAERVEFTLPELAVAPPASVVGEIKSVSPELKEQRKKRREEQKLAKQRAQSRPPTKSPRVKAPTPPPVPPTKAVVAASTTIVRRAVTLTPVEAARFDPEHALAGYVVEVDVAFDESSRDELAMVAKQRPAVVLAGASDALLVRPISSKDGSERRLLGAWKRVGLAKPSYVADERITVVLDASVTAPRKLGRLTDDEWNSLF